MKLLPSRVCIVMVNYRTATLAVDSLNSICKQIADIPYMRTIVVDNASHDGSVEILESVISQRRWDSWANVLPLRRNGGFAFGNNAGISEAFRRLGRVDYIMLLNPDTIVRSGAIRSLVDFMDSHPRVGIAGSHLENSEGAAECSAHNRPSPLGELASGARLGMLDRALRRYVVTPPMQDAAHECDWVSGASLIVRREVFDAIGMLDDGYFLYFEESDFCLRAQKANWKIWFVPDSRVIHLEGISTGIRNILLRRPRYWYDSRRRYFVKHFGVFGLVLADALWIVGRTSFVFRRILLLGSGGTKQHPKWFTFDLLWGDFRSILTGAILEINHKRDVLS